VNIINIESYLLGVITCEMNHTWPEEALKAQAVCSRSFAYMRSRFGADSNLKTAYSMGDTTASQVYKGVTGETTEGTDAVKATIGQIVLSKGKPIDAFFFSTSGGATDSIMDIWGISSSSYAGVFDVFETDPEKKPWVVDFSVNEASERLSSAGYNVGKVISIEPEILTESGRIYRARIKGTSKTLTITGSKLKSIFGLSDTKCRVITSNSTADTVTVIGADDTKRIRLRECYAISDNGTEKLSGNVSQYIVISSDNYYNIPRVLPDEGILRFIGMGWGHGVGMSQSGAKGMAEKGYDYRQIIAYYYNNAEVGGY